MGITAPLWNSCVHNQIARCGLFIDNQQHSQSGQSGKCAIGQALLIIVTISLLLRIVIIMIIISSKITLLWKVIRILRDIIICEVESDFIYILKDFPRPLVQISFGETIWWIALKITSLRNQVNAAVAQLLDRCLNSTPNLHHIIHRQQSFNNNMNSLIILYKYYTKLQLHK